MQMKTAMSIAGVFGRLAPWSAIALTSGLLMAGCDSGPLFRDNYWGKSLLQPDMVLRPADRDANGNPIPDD